MVQSKKKTAEHEEAGWHYSPSSGAAADDSTPLPFEDSGKKPQVRVVEWTASEFVAHEKGFGWYALLAIAAMVATAAVYFVTRDIFSTSVVMVMAITLGIVGARKPKVVPYRLDGSGLTAGKKFYPYSEYKSFAMPEGEPFTSIVLLPMKRFGFPVGAYLAPDNQKQALEALSSRLPLERGELGLVDTLMRQLRF